MPSKQKVRVKQKKPAAAASALPTIEAGFFVDTHGASDGDDFADNAISESEQIPKDATEETLERLLFGDAAGFHDALRDRDAGAMEIALRDGASEGGDGGVEEEEAQEEGGLEHVDDADVGFYLLQI